MSIEFKLPDLGEGIHEAEIIAVKVSEGETVKEDQPILEVETDKAVVEIPSPVAGKVEKIHVKAGEIVTVGSVMISFTTTGEPKTSTPSADSKKPAAVVSAPVASKPAVGQSTSGNGHGTGTTVFGPIPAAPATRRMARELSVDLTKVHGSGPAGRVIKEDVRAFAEGVPSSIANLDASRATTATTKPSSTSEPFTPQPLVAQPVDLPDFSKYGPVERIPMKSIRRKIALNMAQSWSHIPHVTHFDEADITATEASRLKLESTVAAAGGKLTLTVLMLKALASGLKKYPQFNSSLDEKTGEIIYKHYYNIGVAVATERGLIVPVISNVDKKSITDLSIELADIAQKTRAGKIDLDRLQGGTFTVTNIGSIGGTGAVPMINFPEAAILAMARAVQKPVVKAGNVVVRLILPLSMSFDHRIADGAEAALFVRHIADCLEGPLKLLLEG